MNKKYGVFPKKRLSLLAELILTCQGGLCFVELINLLMLHATCDVLGQWCDIL